MQCRLADLMWAVVLVALMLSVVWLSHQVRRLHVRLDAQADRIQQLEDKNSGVIQQLQDQVIDLQWRMRHLETP